MVDVLGSLLWALIARIVSPSGRDAELIVLRHQVQILMRHGRRKLVHITVTTHPTAVWLAWQISEAVPWDVRPEYLVRDRDGAYGEIFKKRIRTMGIRDGPRCTPTIGRGLVYVLGANGALMALDAGNGARRWSVDLKKDYGSQRPGWGFSSSPLVEGSMGCGARPPPFCGVSDLSGE